MTTDHPNLFIVGAAKSGTTFLYEQLRRHPEVFMALKEMHFWATDLHFPKRRMPEDYYFSFFRNARKYRYAGEATVSNLPSREAAGNIHSFNPDARIIISLRNPVEMIRSLHNQMVFNGNENIASLEEALRAEPERRAMRNIPPLLTSPVEFLEYTKMGAYAEQVDRYLSVFGKEQVLILWYEDLKKDANIFLRQVWDFLELEPVPVKAARKVNPSKTARWPWMTRLLAQRTPSRIRLVKALVPTRSLRYRLVEWLDKLNQQPAPAEPLPDNLRKQIRDTLHRDVEKLSQLTGRDLSHWLT